MNAKARSNPLFWRFLFLRGELMAIERHGWITPLPGGVRMDCGGPTLCRNCQAEEDEYRQKHKMKDLAPVAARRRQNNMQRTEVDL